MSAEDETGKTTPRALAQGEASAARGEQAELPREAPGRYAVPEGVRDVELGRGGMGRVLRLAEVSLAREVAVKELLPEHRPGVSPLGPAMVAQFIREARVLARLEHPGVTPIYELGQRDDGTVYYSMKRVRGRTLEKALEDCATLEERLALLPHVLDMVQTVASAHAHGVVHRDLKPANVMVGPYGETLVVDWGLAVVDGAAPSGGASAGTPAYMSPEQAKGASVDARSDLWSLGACLFEVLTGHLPFEAGTVTAVLRQVQEAPVPSPRSLEPHVPPALAEVCVRALQRDPQARYPSAEAMAEALQAAMQGRARQALGTTPWLVAAGLAVVTAVAALAWGIRSQERADEATARGERAVAEARRGQVAPLEREAAEAARQREDVRALLRAREALALGPAPLAAGVAALVEERGAPTRQWRTGTEAGCAAVLAVGDVVACATLGGVELYAAETGALAGRLSSGPGGWQQALALAGPGQLLAGGDDRVLRTWDVATRKEVARVEGLGAGVTALSADQGVVAVGLRDGRVGVVEGGAFRETFRHQGPVRSVLVGPGVVASAAVGLLRVAWDGGAAVELPRTASALLSLADGRVAAGVERSVVLLSRTAPPVSLSGHRDDVLALAEVQGRLVSGGADGVVRALFPDGALQATWDGEVAGVQVVAEAPGGVVVADRRRGLARWSLPAPPERLPEDGVPTAHLWTDQGWMLSGLRDGRIRRVDLDTHEVGFVEAAHHGAVRVLVAVKGEPSAARLRFLSGGDDGRVLAQRWSGEVLLLDEVPGGRVTALAVDEQGTRAAWAFADGTRVLFGLEAMKPIARVEEAVVTVLRFAPGAGRVLAAGREDKRVSLLDADTFREQGRLEELDGPVTSLAFGPRGEALYAGDRSGAVSSWDVANRRRVHAAQVSQERVGALAVSADGALLAVGSDDGSVELLRVGDGLPLALVPADAGDVLAVHFDAQGGLRAIGTDRVPHRWPVEALLPRRP